MARLPIVGEDNWGDILNEYLLVSHIEDGTVRPAAIADKAAAADLTAHTTATTVAHTAAAIGYTPTAPLTATTTQAAIDEVAGILPPKTKSIAIWDSAAFNALSDWTITTDGVSLTQSVTNRKARVTNTNSPASTITNMRHWFVDTSMPATDSEVTTLMWGGTNSVFHVNSELYQQGTVHRAQQSGAIVTGFIAWPDVAFGSPQIINIGIWRGTGAAMTINFVNFEATGLLKKHPVTNAVRASNVVTLTVPLGHNVKVAESIQVDLSDNGFDGGFSVTSVTPTTIVYSQTGANASGATGTVFSRSQVYPYWLKSRLVDNTLHAKVWRYGEPESDWGDTTRAGSFTYSSGTPAGTTGPGYCGIYAGHIGNTHFVDFGQTTFTKLG